MESGIDHPRPRKSTHTIINSKNFSYCVILLTIPSILVILLHQKLCITVDRLGQNADRGGATNKTIIPALWSSAQERAYPLAFAVIIHEDAERAARLFRLIYRPHNAYCVHIDRKAAPTVEPRFKHLIRDLNLTHVDIVPSVDRISVNWGTYSVLNVTLSCSRRLIDYRPVNWKYFLNMNEKELPLRTNWELVAALQALNGSNSVEADLSDDFSIRFPKFGLDFEVTWVKGSYHVALRRDFVHFMLTDARAVRLQQVLSSWTSLSFIPDELFFSTLAYNTQLGAPGACLDLHGSSPNDRRSWHVARYCPWPYVMAECRSKVKRNNICMIGVGDLPILFNRPEFLVNKFVRRVEPRAYDLVEAWLVAKNEFERRFDALSPDFQTVYYEQLYCSTRHI